MANRTSWKHETSSSLGTVPCNGGSTPLEESLLRRQELTHGAGWVRQEHSGKVSVCTLRRPHSTRSREGCHW